METLILYFGKVIICSGVMFLYYQLSLKDKTFHHYNRFYLLSAMLISILLPLIKVEDFTIEVSNDLYLLINKIQNLNTNKTTDNDYIYFRIIFSALGLVSFYFLGKLVYGILKISKFKNQFHKETFEGVNFYQTNLSEAPFSYFKNLFWKNSIVINSDIGKQILKHEMVHIEQKHSYDKIFIEIMTAVFWFNPFFHIIKKEISLIHEYLADKKAVKKSDTKAFAQMLLASHFSGTQLPATSPFLSSNLKKRLKMLQKPQTKFGYARRIFALPVLFTVAFAYMVNAKNKEITETNIEIEKTVSEIKKDTISPKSNIDQIVERQEAKISKANEKLKIQAEKLKTLSEKSKEKALELKKIAKEKGENSYDFELKAKELKQLSGEMDKIVDKDLAYQLDFDKIENLRAKLLAENPELKFKNLEFKRVFPDGDNYRIQMDGNEHDIEKLFDSKEFRENSEMSEVKIKALKEKMNNPEFRDKLNKVNKLYLNGSGVYSGSNFPKFEVESHFKSPSNLSKKDQRKLEKLAKEKAELSRKQAEISKKQAEIVREKAQNNPWIISVDAHAKPNVKYAVKSSYIDGTKLNDKAIAIAKTYQKDGFKNLVKSDLDDNIKIYINGKSVSKEEMNNLNPNDISSINVNKSNSNGKQTGEIHIKIKD
ncbi:MAG: antirepressor [Chryseobacterium sp.]|uniref:M56 family metallopeptidase n=1 Tax=Chryseobacterium sp. TaxID=1871047 RepID=UPI00260AE5C6|nr:M56 family metallopeptidase [Chryseobacterium sp.]MDF2552412.1 antirepressor [Chryseobacterium sp.]